MKKDFASQIKRPVVIYVTIVLLLVVVFNIFLNDVLHDKVHHTGTELAKEVYELNDNGKKTKKVFSLDKTKSGIKLNLGGKKSKSRSLKNAMKKFNKAVRTCKRKGFKKC